MGLFVTSADAMYSPITTLQRNNRLVKRIPWSAFKMSDQDWTQVVDAHDILGVSTLNFMSVMNALPSVRIPIEFNSTFPLKNTQHSGVHFPLLKNYKPLGRRGEIHRDTPCTRMPLVMVLRRSGSITRTWTRSPVSF